MSDLTDVCTLCASEVTAQFTGGTRTQATITGHVSIPGPCYVADQIRFVSPSMLIFNPDPAEENQQNEFSVVCRKLIIEGGTFPTEKNPCSPTDPGSRYGNTNVITWQGRLAAAPAGDPIGPPPPQPAETGLPGFPGLPGNPGSDGASPAALRQKEPAKLVIIALQVEVLNKGNLVIDWAGQDGGKGGQGQVGGNAGSGTTGNNGSDASWPGSGCDTPTGSGGTGGDGGAGGQGGNGGNGGNAGQIIVISLPQNIAPSGPFSDLHTVTFVTTDLGGAGGAGAHGGVGGPGGDPGVRSSECGPATKGTPGNSMTTHFGGPGQPGNAGTSTVPKLEPITSDTCADRIPRRLVFAASNQLPKAFIRCSSGSVNGKLSLTGQYLDQVGSVSTSLAGVTAAINPSSTDTQLDLDISISATSVFNAPPAPPPVADLIFTYMFPSTLKQTLPGAIQVEVVQAGSITPNTGAQGATVLVTITGQGFNPSATVHDVSVSGTGVTVTAGTVTVVDDQTMTCNFVIGPGAPKTARDVTVKAGTAPTACQFTLTDSFTVT
jgi:IPT/TIG domain